MKTAISMMRYLLLPLLLLFATLVTETTSFNHDTYEGDQQGLTLSVYKNTALFGSPSTTQIIQTPTWSFPSNSNPLSAEITGTLSVVNGSKYKLVCDFGTAILTYLHIDDHLICQSGANSPSGTVTTDDLPLLVLSKKELPFRLAIVHSPNKTVTTTNTIASVVTINVNITQQLSNGTTIPLPLNSLHSHMPSLEAQRRTLQQNLLHGWGSWYEMNLLNQVLLPEGQIVNLALCDLQRKSCIEKARIDDAPRNGAQLRLNEHAVDRSYSHLFLTGGKCNVSISFGGGNELLILVEPVNSGGCKNHAIVAIGTTAWYRHNDITTQQQGTSSLVFQGYGLRKTTVYATSQNNESLQLPDDVNKMPHIAMSLYSVNSSTNNSFGLSSSEKLTISQIQSKLATLKEKEIATYAKFGDLAETKMAVQAAVMWNTVYNPLEYGPMSNIIRGNPFGLNPSPVNEDWPYVIFDWDNTFASYMLSFDSKELGYSALIQIIKSKSVKGFIPNWAASTRKRVWSQPPVGSKVLYEMYKKYKETWIIELLFDDLLDWNNWFYDNRRLAPLNITCLGGPYMQAGRWESGMDNSPMYDGWNGSFINGKMQLYDVGMASLHTMDSSVLATLAKVIGRTEDATLLQIRADTMRKLIIDNLWDEKSGIYVNLMPNGTFYRSVSPTSFYPLMTQGPPVDHVEQMMTKWLMNPARFCISPNGDFKGNTDDCYWGLPSISADDPAFPKLGYWRGYVWGPLSMLTYWGLQEYDHIATAKQARHSMCKQMNQLMLSQWRAHRHICENYNPHKNGTECTGMHFYHWGALTGFISLLEAGYYDMGAF